MALSTAISKECAAKDTAMVQGQAAIPVTSIHKIGTKPKHLTKKKQEKCLYCGGRNHPDSDCYFKDAIRHQCNQKGHIKIICSKAPKSSTKYTKNVHQVQERSDSEDSEVMCLHQLHAPSF